MEQKDLENYEKDRVGKYAEFFKGNEILPIPEIIKRKKDQAVVTPPFQGEKHVVFLVILAVARMVIWQTRVQTFLIVI